jgi:hypothetical protein
MRRAKKVSNLINQSRGIQDKGKITKKTLYKEKPDLRQESSLSLSCGTNTTNLLDLWKK